MQGSRENERERHRDRDTETQWKEREDLYYTKRVAGQGGALEGCPSTSAAVNQFID